MSESKRVRLRANQGADEANMSGYAPFKVNPNDKTVEVPEEAVSTLLEKGGFELVDPPARAPANHMIPVRHTSDHTLSCSWGNPDANGIIMVPAHAVVALLSHGFVPVADEVAVAPEPKKVEAEPAPVVVTPATKVVDAKGK